MTEEKAKTQDQKVDTKSADKAPAKKSTKKRVSFVGKDSKGKGDKRGPRRARPKSEFEQVIIGIRRVVRVMGGGRRFSFSVAMVVGDKKGRVGFGHGKASDTAIAIDKAVKQAKKNMITVPRTTSGSIPRSLDAKFESANVMMRPAPGKGLVAGSSVRVVLDLAGITDVNAKVLSRSKNKFNIAKATISALSKIKADDVKEVDKRIEKREALRQAQGKQQKKDKKTESK